MMDLQNTDLAIPMDILFRIKITINTRIIERIPVGRACTYGISELKQCSKHYE